MVKLSRVKIFKRAVLSALCLSLLLGGAFVAAKMIKTFHVNAAEDTNKVTIESPNGTWIMYKTALGETYANGGLSTPRIKVTNYDGSPVEYKAFCIHPAVDAPGEHGGNYDRVIMSENETNAKIKLAIYLASVSMSPGKFTPAEVAYVKTIMEDGKDGKYGWFNPTNIAQSATGQNWTTGGAASSGAHSGTYPNINNDTTTPTGLQDFEYLFIHLAIGRITEPDKYIFSQMNQADLTLIDTIGSELGDLITSDDDSWLMAKNYVLYGINPESNPSDTSPVQNVVWIEDGNPEFGSIKVKKCDQETNTCTPQGGANFQGIQFTVANTSGDRIYAQKITNNNTGSVNQGTHFFDNGEILVSGSTGADGTVTFGDLPLNVQYTVTETATNSSYLATASAQDATVISTSEATTLTFKDKVVRGDLKFVKKDESTGDPMANVAFQIESNTTHEKHIIVSNSNGEVNTATVAHSRNTNGYDNLDLDTITYSDQIGTWFYGVASGTGATVDDTRGALPYDTYTITELECDANKYCYGVESETMTVTIQSNGVTVDKGEWSNNCAEFSIGTVATDGSDGDKFIEASSTAVITDTISYCAKEGLTYTIHGVLMDKSTGQPLLVNGNVVQREITITPTTDCGTATMTFELDTSELVGKDIVVFETLLYEGEEVASHSDINDASQTVTVIGVGTTAVDGTDGDEFIEASIAKITDTVSYCLKEGLTYTIHGILMDKSTGQPLLVNGNVVQKEITITPTTNCGTATMTFEFDASDLAGTDIVVFESLFLNDDPVISHEDINDEDQTVYVIDLATTATDNSDGDKTLAVNTDVEVKDVVEYCLKAGVEYTLKGVLMDKSTNSPLIVNGSRVEQTVTFTPGEDCGTTEMIFSFNTTGMADAGLVVFEDLYYDDELIISHEDINDADQSISVAPNPPETGHITASTGGSAASDGGAIDGKIIIAATVVVIFGGYFCIRLHSKRKFYGRRR